MTSIQSVLPRTLSSKSSQVVPVDDNNEVAVVFSPSKISARRIFKKSNKAFKESTKDHFFESMEVRMFRVGRLLVEQQLADFSEDGSLLCFVCCGQLEQLIQAIDKIPEDDREKRVVSKDGAGATIIHIAYLFQHFHIGRYLVERFPNLAAVRYDVVEAVEGDYRMMPYLGENILHIAIAHRAHDEVDWLLKFFSEKGKSKTLMKLLGARTFGHFFQPLHTGIGIYFGELPIHFAACSNDFVLFDLILAADPNAIFFTDSYGNNLLHLCTIHQLIRMFDYISNHARVIIRRQLERNSHGQAISDTDVQMVLHEKLLYIYNNDSLTPFTLAAKTGKLDMFAHIMGMKKTKQWSYGPVDCSIVDLIHFENYRDDILKSEESIKTKFLSRFSREADICMAFEENTYPDLEDDKVYMESLGIRKLTDEEKPLKMGALDYICLSSTENFDMINFPEVKEFIQKKWDRFGYPYFFKSSMFGMLRTLLVSLIICFYEFGENDTAADWIIWLLYPVTWCTMLFNFKSDIYQMSKYGLNHFGFDGTIRGAGLLENVCSTSEFIFFTLAIFLRVYTTSRDQLNEDSSARIMLAVTTLTCWIRILYIFMGFERTGNFVVIVANILLDDIPLFMWIYVTILFGFGSAVAALSNNIYDNRSVPNSIRHYLHFIWNIFRYTVDGQNNEVFDESIVKTNALWLYQILGSWYNLLIVLLLLNLLIAMLSETYSTLIDKSSAILLRERYNMMCSFEKGMYDEEIRESMQSYCIMSGNHPVFEIQTTNPNWSKSGNAESDCFDEDKKGEVIDMPEKLRNMATTGDTEALQNELIKLPRLVNCRDASGATLLHWSVSNGWFDTVEMLLSFSIDMHVCDYTNGETVMHDAVKAYCASSSEKREACAQIITLLIKRGADYSRRNASHMSPLDVARAQSSGLCHYYDEVLILFNEGAKLRKQKVESANTLGLNRITSDASYKGRYKLTLLIIDPQVDFHPGGALGVPNANEDALRVQQFIRDYIDDIEDIVVTQDSHHLNHIAHAVFWEDSEGKEPPPYTSISQQDVCQGRWIPKNRKLLDYCKQYTKDLESSGKFVLTIWPDHCLLGSPGHCVVEPIQTALMEWSRKQKKEVEYVMKGQNSLTEMYSAIMAEVPMPDDPGTQLNSKLLRRLQSSRQLVVCGQALSHCVNFTVRDLVKHWRSDKSRILLMRDGSSPVAGFEAEGERFIEDMKSEGLRIITSKDDFLLK